MKTVEWLIKQIGLDHHTGAWKKEIEQAKEMEKQQIKDAYNRGYQDATNDYTDMSIFDDSEQYYNETYKKD
jgi:predicted secreted protein